MLNAEKFKDKIMYSCDGEFGFTDGIVKCAYDKCDNCIFSNRNNQNKHESCSSRRVRWLLSEYKEPIKLTRFEHDVLKHLLEKTQYRFIVREKSDSIYIYKRKPKKGLGAWDISTGMQNLNIFVNLFPFIKWEDSEPTSIEDVLNNCEVVNDAEE